MTQSDIGIVEKLKRAKTFKIYLGTVLSDYEIPVNSDGPEAAAIIMEMVEALEAAEIALRNRDQSELDAAALQLVKATLAKVRGK